MLSLSHHQTSPDPPYPFSPRFVISAAEGYLASIPCRPFIRVLPVGLWGVARRRICPRQMTARTSCARVGSWWQLTNEKSFFFFFWHDTRFTYAFRLLDLRLLGREPAVGPRFTNGSTALRLHFPEPFIASPSREELRPHRRLPRCEDLMAFQAH